MRHPYAHVFNFQQRVRFSFVRLVGIALDQVYGDIDAVLELQAVGKMISQVQNDIRPFRPYDIQHGGHVGMRIRKNNDLHDAPPLPRRSLRPMPLFKAKLDFLFEAIRERRRFAVQILPRVGSFSPVGFSGQFKQ